MDREMKSISKIQKLASQAFRTFCIPVKEPMFLDTLHATAALANQIQKSDVNFSGDLVSDVTKWKYDPRINQVPPVTYIKILDAKLFSVGIFVLKNGARLPLHDHPGMHGIIRVIHGTLSVKSYTEVPVEVAKSKLNLNSSVDLGRLGITPVVTAGDVSATPSDGCCQLFPDEGNYHEVSARVGPAAFLDVLAPPYDTNVGRDCHYYTEVPLKESATISDSSGVLLLKEVECPPDFWCGSAPYNGPPVADDWEN